MKSYKNVKIGDMFVISKGTEFFSISLQESLIATRDIVIKVTHKCVPVNYIIFGNI